MTTAGKGGTTSCGTGTDPERIGRHTTGRDGNGAPTTWLRRGLRAGQGSGYGRHADAADEPWTTAASSSPMMPMHHQTMRRSAGDHIVHFYVVTDGTVTARDLIKMPISSTGFTFVTVLARVAPRQRCILLARPMVHAGLDLTTLHRISAQVSAAAGVGLV